MNRCAPFLLALALSGVASAQSSSEVMTVPVPGKSTTTTTTVTTTSTSDGQAVQRNFPKEALRGTIVFFAPPAIKLNDVNTQMAPAYRIHGTNNLLVMSAQLNGMKATVDYTTDVQGQVREVWILSPAEAAKTWPTTAAQAAAWSFDAIAQTWTKP
ncbi:MAG TPA: hypothetical protein VIP05_06050 [Burkholderiaceae bacterium]